VGFENFAITPWPTRMAQEAAASARASPGTTWRGACPCPRRARNSSYLEEFAGPAKTFEAVDHGVFEHETLFQESRFNVSQEALRP